MSTTPTRSGLHPMLWVAAASVTAVSLAGVAKLSGILPDFGKSAAPETAVVAPSIPAPAPVAVPDTLASAAPVAAKPEANTTPAEGAHREAHKPVQPKPHPKPPATHPAQAAAGGYPPPPDAAPAPRDMPAPGEARAARRVGDTPAVCRECGVIEHVEAIQQKGEGSGLGAVGGAILGGVLGHQVGEGSGKKIARIGGAVLGGFAGNEAERRYRTVSHYQVTVRLEDGTRRVIEQQSAPAWQVGDAVRIQDGQIVAAAPRSSRRSNDF